MAESRVRRRPFILRRQLVVDKKMQFAVLAYTTFVSVVTVFFVGAFVLVLMSSGPVAFDNFQSIALLASMWLFSTVLLTFLGVYVTNKIAGPVYRLRKSMQAIASGGAIENVGFRKGDYFFELADEYNSVLERLRKAEAKK